MNTNESKLITVAEAATILRVNRTTIYRLLNAGHFPGGFRVGSEWRIHRDILATALRERSNIGYK